MNPQLDMLNDIEGLDAISFWPLALGWWIVFTLALVLVYLIFRRIVFIRSWKHETLKKLTHLEQQLTEANARKTTIVLSEYLRRIVLKRFSRKECAGLIADQWLRWLTLHDPQKFDWENKGKILITAPYAPEEMPLSTHVVKSLIQAIKHWVR